LTASANPQKKKTKIRRGKPGRLNKKAEGSGEDDDGRDIGYESLGNWVRKL
jgi:hypothetical protein